MLEIWATNNYLLSVRVSHIVAVLLLELLVDLLLPRLSFLHCTRRLCALFLRLHVERDKVQVWLECSICDGLPGLENHIALT